MHFFGARVQATYFRLQILKRWLFSFFSCAFAAAYCADSVQLSLWLEAARAPPVNDYVYQLDSKTIASLH